jgi:hypothetical protein
MHDARSGENRTFHGDPIPGRAGIPLTRVHVADGVPVSRPKHAIP